MSQELERRAAPTIEESFRVAKGFAMSGYFADAKSAEQAFVKIMAGAEMGLAPFQAMTGIHVISGKPVVGAGLLAAMLDKHPDYDYEVEWEPDEKAPTACTVVILKNGRARGRSRFSLDDAKRAGLTQQNWTKYPGAMLFARALSQAVRWYAAGIVGQSVYVEGEEAPDVLPPHIQALDEQPPERDPADTLVALAADILDAHEIENPDDLPFEVAAPAVDAAESQVETGQIAAEPAAAPTGGGLLETLDDAFRFVNQLEKPQLEALRALLRAATPITRRALAGELLDQRFEWTYDDVRKELA